MILLITSILILLILIIFIFVKVKYRFWTLQPLYHKYNIAQVLGPKMKTINNFTKINRYVNIVDIKTKKVLDIDKIDREKITNFIKTHVLQSKNFTYFPDENNIFTYLEFTNSTSSVTLYNKPYFTLENNIVNSDIEYIGLITSRPLYITFKKKNFSINYLDHLSLHNGYKESDTIYKLIQTHIYNTSTNSKEYNNTSNKVFLLKHFRKPFIIKSLTSFKLICYDITLISSTSNFHALYNIIELGMIHATLINAFLQKQKIYYECIIIPDLSNLFSLIKTKNIILYGVIVNRELVSLYVYKNIVTHFEVNYKNIDNNKEKKKPNAIMCLASLIDQNYKDILFLGFLISLKKCSNSLSSRYLFIETLSNNIIINNKLEKISKKVFAKKGHYILYNYLSPYIKSNKCFILC